MIADQPFVSYKHNKEPKTTKKSMDRLYEQWKSKKEKEGESNDPMAGFMKKSTTLSDFFKDK